MAALTLADGTSSAATRGAAEPVLATACAKEFDIPQEDLTSTPITITARYCGDEQPATRVAYSESGSDISATWQSGDQIYVVYNGHVNTLDLTDGADTATAPALPAETLADYCYSYMFYGCNALTTAPELLATTLRTSCYRYMFNGCSNLRSITCLATKNRLSNCTSAWSVAWLSRVPSPRQRASLGPAAPPASPPIGR